jgi:hypothetical protein
MGLQKQIELESGVVLPEAYAKVATFYFYNTAGDNSYVNIEVNIFKDKEARDAGKPEVAKFVHKCSNPKFTEYFSLSVLNDVDKNMISQSYEWLKTMSIYSGATDIEDSKE